MQKWIQKMTALFLSIILVLSMVMNINFTSSAADTTNQPSFSIKYVNTAKESDSCIKDSDNDGRKCSSLTSALMNIEIVFCDESGNELTYLGSDKDIQTTVPCNGSGGHEKTLEEIVDLLELGSEQIPVKDSSGNRFYSTYKAKSAQLIIGENTYFGTGDNADQIKISYNSHNEVNSGLGTSVWHYLDNGSWINIAQRNGTTEANQIYSGMKIRICVERNTSTLGRTNDIVTVSESTTGIKFKLFDYSNDINTISDYLPFYGETNGSSSAGSTSYADQYRAGAYQGIIKKTLPSDGYPMLVTNYGMEGSTDWLSLGYLFGGSTSKIIKQYPTDHLLYETLDGYYEYDSSQYAADYDAVNERFRVRSYVEYSNYKSDSYDFLPLNTTVDSTDHVIPVTNVNYWFGMTMETDFLQPKDGIVEETNKDMVFQFSGDDDVWIFVDGVLVFEISGTHGAQSGEINFSTGNITYNTISGSNQNKKITGTIGSTLRECFEDAGYKEEQLNQLFDGNTFKDYSTHEMKYFYLERGGGKSNCHIKFNLQTIPDGALSVTKSVEGLNENIPNQEYQLQLLLQYTSTDTEGKDDTEPVAKTVKYKIGETEYEATDGMFTLKAGETATFLDIPVNANYIIKELNSSDYNVSFTHANTTENATLDGTTAVSTKYAMDDTNTVNNSVVVTNSAKPYSVTVSKTFSGVINTVPEDFDASFSLYQADSSGIKTGTALETVTWKDFVDNQYTFTGLLSGNYVVEETNPSHNASLNLVHTGITYNPENALVTLTTENSAGKINVDNQYKYVTKILTVSKTVDGNMGDRNKAFTFKLVIEGYTTDLKYASDQNNVLPFDSTEEAYVFTLTNGESISLILPYECKYGISEADYSTEGYTTTHQVENSDIQKSNLVAKQTLLEDTTVQFTNTKHVVTPTGITTSYAPYLLLIALGIGVIAFFFSTRKVRR